MLPPRTLALAKLLIGPLTAVLLGLLLIALRSHFIGVGEAQERARWEARQMKVERQAQQDFAANVQLGNQAAADQLADERQVRRHADGLTTERRHATLTLPPPACLAPVARAELQPDASPPAAPAAEPPGGADGVRLTADAVRLWNSALAGHDVPAGACGADAAAGGPCAANAGLTVADAWDNQAANALACRIDRARLTRLQTYLKQTEN